MEARLLGMLGGVSRLVSLKNLKVLGMSVPKTQSQSMMIPIWCLLADNDEKKKY